MRWEAESLMKSFQLSACRMRRYPKTGNREIRPESRARWYSVAAKQMRRLFGSRENAVRQDALLAADVDTNSGEETDYAARAAYRKANKK